MLDRFGDKDYNSVMVSTGVHEMEKTTMFAVIRTSFTPCDCGSHENRNVEFVTTDEKAANDFVEDKENNMKPTPFEWTNTYTVEEVEVR